MTTTHEVTKARNGVWTPWSAVLCVVCDYAALKDSLRATHYAKHVEALAAMNRTEEVERPDSQLIGDCNNCHCACWVRYDVSLLQQVGFKAADLNWEGPFSWELEQTGGMCAALTFSTEGRKIVVTAMDGTIYVGEYAVTAGEEEWWDHPLRKWESAPIHGDDNELKDASALKALVEEAARKAIEFIRTPAEEIPS